MVTPQFIETGKRNLEKCPTRHGKKNTGAGRPKSQLKGIMAETGVSKDDFREACQFVLFNFTFDGLKDLVKNKKDETPVIIIALAEMLINNCKKGGLTNVERMLKTIYGEQ